MRSSRTTAARGDRGDGPGAGHGQGEDRGALEQDDLGAEDGEVLLDTRSDGCGLQAGVLHVAQLLLEVIGALLRLRQCRRARAAAAHTREQRGRRGRRPPRQVADRRRRAAP